MKDKKQLCDISVIFPDKNAIAHVFWLIILNCPAGFITHTIMLILSEGSEFLLIARTGFDIQAVDTFLNQIYDNSLFSGIILDMLIAIIAFYFLNLLIIWYLYRVVTKQGKQIVSSPSIQILQKYMGMFLSSVGSFFTHFILIMVIFSFYQIFTVKSSPTSSNNQTLLLVLLVIVIILLFTFKLIYEGLFNLNFANEMLMCARLGNRKFAYLRQIHVLLIITLGLQPNYTNINKILSLLAMIVIGFFKMHELAQVPQYFNQKLNAIHLYVKVLKNAFTLTLLLTNTLQLSTEGFFFLGIIVLPTLLGGVYHAHQYFRNKVYHRILQGQLQKQRDIEIALYALLEGLESTDYHEHHKFMSVMMQYEEDKSNSVSYYESIAQIIRYKQQLPFGFSLDEQKALLEEEERKLDEYSQEFGTQLIESMVLSHEQHSTQHQETQSIENPLKSSEYQVRGSVTKSIINLFTAQSESQTSTLFDLFSNDSLKKRTKDEGKSENMFVSLGGINIDISNFEQAIKKVKIQFLHDCIAKKAANLYPRNQTIQFFKAFVTMNLLQNKHLTLSAITHIHLESKKEGYFKQIESLISQNYFLHQSMKKQVLVSEEIDTEEMLKQSLQIDQILLYIKKCTEKIAIFWQILSSQDVNREQIEEMLNISMDISQMLKKIKIYLKSMGSIDNFQSSCQSLYFYLCHFFTMVLRDSNQGHAILKHMLNMRSLGIQSHQKNSLIDEVGLAVVDGSFNLYGKIQFVNKTLVKLLNYKNEDFQDKRIHILMPDAISEVHNKFWQLFAQQGVPKILDKTRLLYVKDKDGYIYPYKIFIRFLYHPEFGYCFTGIFRKPKTIIFDDQEQPVKVRKTFTMICDSHGKILEISKTCNNLFKITPKILDKFHNSLTDNFNLSYLNPQLQIKNIDFSKNNCIFYRFITLYFQNIKNIAQMVEVTEDNEKSIFQSLRPNFKAQMKIVKETYGSPKSALVSLYYVIFSEFNATQNTLNGAVNGQYASFNPRLTTTSMNQFEEMDSEVDSDNLFFGSAEEKNNLNSITGKSISTESMMGPASASISSSGQSTSKSVSDTNNEIKYVEEGIDYEKTPKPLMLMKLGLVCICLISTCLSSVQFGLNRQWDSQHNSQLSLLENLVNCEESISTLLMMSRTFLNINLGLESNNSTYFEDRRKYLTNISLSMIENSRIAMKNIQQYMSLIQGQKNYNKDFKEQNVTLYDLYLNKSVAEQVQQRYYSFDDWLIHIDDMFALGNTSVSTLYTFLYNPTLQINANDQQIFFVFENGEGDLQSQIKMFKQQSSNFISDGIAYSSSINTVFIIITGVILMLLILVVIYFMIFFFSFKYKVLGYFAELEKESIHMSELCANEFQHFLQSDNYEIIKKNQQVLQEYEIAKAKNNVDEIIQQQRRGIMGNGKKMLDYPEETSRLNKLQQQQLKKIKRQEKINAKLNQKALQSGDFLDKKQEESKSEDEQDWDLKKKNKPKQQEPGKKKQEKIPSISDLSSVDISDISLKDKFSSSQFSQYEQQDLDPNKAVHRNKVIVARLKELRIKRITQLLIYGSIVAMILIVYFVVQYLLFVSDASLDSSQAQMIIDLSESMECTSAFVKEVRDYQTSNSTNYTFDAAQMSIIEQVPVKNRMDALNVTYSQCIQTNENTQQWFSQFSNSEYLDGSMTLCDYMESQSMMFGSINLTTCESIFQGIMKKNVLQQTSLFIQDTLYYAIAFDSEMNKSADFLKFQLNKPSTLELLDAVIFFHQFGLRAFYSGVQQEILQPGQVEIITLALFIVFLILLLMLTLIINFVLLPRIRTQFWNAFYILKLLPRDDIKPSFIKRINEFLNKA